MEEWKEYKLHEIGRIVGGATPPTKDSANYDGEISWITPKDLSNFTGRYIQKGERSITQKGFDSSSCQILPKGSILFSSRAPIGYIAIAANELCTNQGFKSIIPDNNLVNNLFLYYLLKYNKEEIEGLGSGTTFKEVSAKVMQNFDIKIPSIQTQKKIADILSSLDDKIELNRRINDNLEQQAQALFKSWFVDFEPFKEGKFVDSELGIIPESWRVCSAETIFKINIGKTPPRKEQQWFSNINNGNVKWISISDLGSNEIFIEDSKEYLTKEAISKFNIIVVPEDTILVSFKLTVGRVGISNCELTTNEAVARFYLPKSYFREYTYLSLKNYNYARLGSTSSIATAVNSKIIKNMKLLIPPVTIISEFSKRINPLFNAIRIYENEIRNLSKIRNTLLPKLISGELKINDTNN